MGGRREFERLTRLDSGMLEATWQLSRGRGGCSATTQAQVLRYIKKLNWKLRDLEIVTPMILGNFATAAKKEPFEIPESSIHAVLQLRDIMLSNGIS